MAGNMPHDLGIQRAITTEITPFNLPLHGGKVASAGIASMPNAIIRALFEGATRCLL